MATAPPMVSIPREAIRRIGQIAVEIVVKPSRAAAALRSSMTLLAIGDSISRIGMSDRWRGGVLGVDDERRRQ